jgi:hypothetical protein
VLRLLLMEMTTLYKASGTACMHNMNNLSYTNCMHAHPLLCTNTHHIIYTVYVHTMCMHTLHTHMICMHTDKHAQTICIYPVHVYTRALHTCLMSLLQRQTGAWRVCVVCICTHVRASRCCIALCRSQLCLLFCVTLYISARN